MQKNGQCFLCEEIKNSDAKRQGVRLVQMGKLEIGFQEKKIDYFTFNGLQYKQKINLFLKII